MVREEHNQGFRLNGWEVLVSSLYVLIGILVVAFSAIGVVVSRRRKAPSFDHVSQGVLNRLRTEYR